MTCNNEIHQDDLGTEFIVTIVECVNNVETPVDISTATAKEIIFIKPDSTKITATAEFTTPASGGAGDGTDGKISYFTTTGDLSLTGTYKIQGIVTTPAGKWHSTISKFKVVGNL